MTDDYDITWIAIATAKDRYRKDGTIASATCSGATPEEALAKAIEAVENRQISIDLSLIAKEPRAVQEFCKPNELLALIGIAPTQPVTRRR